MPNTGDAVYLLWLSTVVLIALTQRSLHRRGRRIVMTDVIEDIAVVCLALSWIIAIGASLYFYGGNAMLVGREDDGRFYLNRAGLFMEVSREEFQALVAIEVSHFLTVIGAIFLWIGRRSLLIYREKRQAFRDFWTEIRK
ncbi:MAG: hypothetical protein AAFV19_11190 [Pseudomonadota bacterium]